jgi:hypothetical protein
MFLTSMCAALICGYGALPVWEFDTEADKNAWQPNVHIADVHLENGTLCGKTVDWDPMFFSPILEMPATPWQYVLLRIKVDHPGTGQLFWTGETEGKYGGISEQKVTNFTVGDSADFQEIAILPGWHREGTIRKLRLDLYNGINFAIDSIAVLDWGSGLVPDATKTAWSAEEMAQWPEIKGDTARFSPPLAVNVGELSWAAVEVESPGAAHGEFLWMVDSSQGIQSESFDIRPGKRVYNIELGGHPCWKGLVQAAGLRLSTPEAKVGSLKLADLPAGGADPLASYFGFENGVNRAEQPCSVLVQITNQGGEKAPLIGYRLTAAGDAVKIVQSPDLAALTPLAYGDVKDLLWQVQADKPGEYALRVEGPGLDVPMEARFRFLPPVSVAKADYVPAPVPVKPALDVCMYYFPGWESDAKWDCIRRTAPIRKPLLGYYDESKVECVDWQIKWALENGVNCFLVDWYWCDGTQYLTHWFEAYRKARYRDQLQVAIMWANHNAPGTHSRGDWRRVTREWIDRYFNLPAYYRINNKPAIFLWNPEGLRNDLGGADAVKAALDESQEMARAAGFAGIEFVAMSGHHTRELAETLAKEGYSGATNYHEWGQAESLAASRSEIKFSDAVKTAPEAWQKNSNLCAPDLTYYPVVETGWDNRPWAGSKAMVLGGRTAPLFEDLLRAGRGYCEAHKLPFVVLAPANEWGEGSYVEPANEYGFDMYEAIRRAFGTGDPATWPVNYSPRDLGLGPYDFPATPYRGDWTFDSGKEGWSEMMNTTSAEVKDGLFSFRTVAADPALVVSTPGLNAGEFPKLVIRMRVHGPGGQQGSAQLFWSAQGSNTSESASVRFPLQADGKFHDYTVDVSQNPRWRGRISMLRFDPTDFKDAEIDIDRITFQK